MKKQNNDFFNDQSPYTCFICRDLFSYKRKPLILVCGHTFCEPCLINLFDKSKEIQCSFCKVITKLDRFDDMIINYAILSIVDFNEKFKFNDNNPILCEIYHKNYDNVEKNLQCIDCKTIVCTSCIDNHKNHKMKNLTEYIDNEAMSLSEFLKCYRELSTKMTSLIRKIDKNDLENIVKEEKQNLKNYFNELHNQIDREYEAIGHAIDKIANETINSIDIFKKNIKVINSDAQRYCSIIEEFNNYKKSDSKLKAKILSIYNINSTFEEIKNFNKEIDLKSNKLLSADEFKQRLINKIKNCCVYKNKIKKILDIMENKLKKIISNDVDIKYFVNIKRKDCALNESSNKSKESKNNSIK